MDAELESSDQGDDHEAHQCISEQGARDDPFHIVAFVCCELLDQTVGNHGEHQNNTDPHGRTENEATYQTEQDADQFSGAAGTDGELPSADEKGAFRFAVTAKYNGQPTVCP